MDLFKKLNKEDGVTRIQVTHSEKNAAYGNRIINLLDGRIRTCQIKNHYNENVSLLFKDQCYFFIRFNFFNAFLCAD